MQKTAFNARLKRVSWSTRGMQGQQQQPRHHFSSFICKRSPCSEPRQRQRQTCHRPLRPSLPSRCPCLLSLRLPPCSVRCYISRCPSFLPFLPAACCHCFAPCGVLLPVSGFLPPSREIVICCVCPIVRRVDRSTVACKKTFPLAFTRFFLKGLHN